MQWNSRKNKFENGLKVPVARFDTLKVEDESFRLVATGDTFNGATNYCRTKSFRRILHYINDSWARLGGQALPLIG